jgi:hypothetical protein
MVKWLRKKIRADISDEKISEQVSQNIRDTGGNPLFRALMDLELFGGRIISYPFGIRCLLTAQKNDRLGI